MNDRVRDSSQRKGFDANGRVVIETHETDVTLTRGLKPFFTINGKPVAVVGSSGDNASPDHTAPNADAQALVPLKPRAKVVDGADWFTIDGVPIATANSTILLPDSEKPKKTGVMTVAQTCFTVNGIQAARGSA